VNLEDYMVILMYTDTDNDKVMIIIDHDVLGALKEYASVGRVKLMTNIKQNSFLLKIRFVHLWLLRCLLSVLKK
jgi:hypothetical protein